MDLPLQFSREFFAENTDKVREDRISKLPDEVIANILSRLTIQEAARTSILSTRWRYQWTYFHGILQFDHSLKMYDLRRRRKGPLRKSRLFLAEWQKFMNCVKQVMKSLRSPTMEGLRICIDLGNPSKLFDWIIFAAQKNVQMLEFHFTYTYTAAFMEIRENIRNVVPSRLLSFSEGTQFVSLKVIRLASVDVSGKVLEQVLACCPSLETLCVRESLRLQRLRVSGQSLGLKHLELVECCLLYLEISAQNLVSFTYHGLCGKMVFKYIPSLVEASFGNMCSSLFTSNMRDDTEYFGLLCQLHVLTLGLSELDVYQEIHKDLPEFHNVKHLELRICHGEGSELTHAVSLLRAFPSISVLKLRFRCYKLSDRPLGGFEANLKHEFQSLKELEVSGFRRDSSQIELLIHVFENAANLKRIAFDPISTFYLERSADVKSKVRNSRRDATKWFVDALKEYIPPSAEVVFL